MSQSPSAPIPDKDILLSRQGRIFDIQRCSLHDGPGIRTTVFLKGCPLRCLWCHNPESICPERQLAYQASLCTFCRRCADLCPQGVHDVREEEHLVHRERCTLCGACVEACPARALEILGRQVSVEEVIEEVLRDRIFYETSGGGMTLSGGEPSLQPDFSMGLLHTARQEGLHTCLDTCGFCDYQTLSRLASSADLVFYDIKETDPQRHKEWTGVDNARILDNLRRLDAGGTVTRLRCPIIPGLNDREDHLRALADLAASLSGCEGVELLGYHRLGQGKRERLGMAPVDSRIAAQAVPAETLESWKDQIRSLGANPL